MTYSDPYADYPEVLKRARGRFKVLDSVETARLGEEWVDDTPGPTVRAVAVYVRDDDGDDAVYALAEELGLREHKPARDEGHPRRTKVAFVQPGSVPGNENWCGSHDCPHCQGHDRGPEGSPDCPRLADS